MKRVLAIAVAVAACGDNLPGPPADAAPHDAHASGHSSSIAITRDGKTLFVVNADSDSISIVDAIGRTLIAEVPLGPAPAVDGNGDFAPAIAPRALALAPDEHHVFVTGQRSGAIHRVDLDTRVVDELPVCSEPIGILADATTVYVACSQDRTVVAVPLAGGEHRVAHVDGQPWALAWLPDGSLAVSLFFGPGIATIDPASMAVTATWTIPDVAPRSDPRLAHGAVRGLYDLAVRPGTDELWVAHAMLGIDTPQPELDFERTAFPALSIFAGGVFASTLSTDAQAITGVDGSFGDIVSGPHAIAFTHDGELALVVDTNSEDVLAVGANRIEAALGRPLPGHMPEGIVLSPDDQLAYIDERNTGDVAVVRITRGSLVALAADGPAIPRLASDPMPAQLRLGEHLFYSANSDEYPITKNHWVACATCHMEGRSDAVTWKFAQGPRDTPSNAGGMLGTGFLFRTADRTKVQDYWHTVNVEQGGTFDPIAQAALLDAITAYVDHAIPLPRPPAHDAMLAAAGRLIFERADVGCSGCHAGPRFTDSASGNPALDLGGTVVLHDVGTCAPGDVDHTDLEGHARAKCNFDTPSLSGVWSSPPYLHDGSAATIHDVLMQTRGVMGDITSLSATELAALEEYVKSL